MSVATRVLVLIAAVLAPLSCGIPEDQYLRKVNEAEALRQDLEGARGQARAVDKKNKILDAALAQKGSSAAQLARDLAAAQHKSQELQDLLSQRGREIAQLSARVTELEDAQASLSKRQQKLLEEKRRLEQKTQEYDSLVNKMKDEIDAGKIEISNLRGRMAVKLKDKVLFASGSARLQEEGKAALVKLAEVLKTIPGKAMRVEGHTDNVPLSGKGRFRNNWELSSARALAVVTYLQDQGVDPSRLSAEGCGEFRPIADNDSPEGRSANRRIEIVLSSLAR